MKSNFVFIAVTVLCFNEIKCNLANDDGRKIRLLKCCPEGQYMKKGKICASASTSWNYFNLSVYDAQLDKSDKPFEDVFELVYGMDETIFNNSFFIGKVFNPYLMEDGTGLYLDKPNALKRWRLLTRHSFCVELSMKSWKPLIFVDLTESDGETYTVENLEYALLVSIGFLFSTLVPYCCCPRLRDLNSTIVVTFITFYTVPVVLFVICRYYIFSVPQVIAIGLIYHFFTISSFCWTNIMFYRIRASSSYEYQPRSSKLLFLKYCAYTITLPLILTAIVAAAELTDLSHIPWFITPHLVESANYLFTANEALVYLYAPLTLLLMFNWVLCIRNLNSHCQKATLILKKPSPESRDHPFSRPSKYMALLLLQTCQVFVEALSACPPEGTGPVLVRALFILKLCLGPALFVIFAINKNVHAWQR